MLPESSSSERLERLVRSRRDALRSLAAVHRGESRWLGVVRFESLGPNVPSGPLTLRWLTLGLSLGALLHLPPGVPFLHAVVQLFEELEFFCASAAVQSVRSLATRFGRVPRWPGSAADGASARQSGGPGAFDGPSDSLAGGGAPVSAALKPALRFSNGAVIYERLLPSASWSGGDAVPLDHSSVLVALCSTLDAVYQKLTALDPSLISQALVVITRIDSATQAHVLAPAARELQVAGAAVLATRLGAVDQLFFGPDSALAVQLGLLAASATGLDDS
ncbi:hypothetical protein T492DRAFT_899368 [Pavlovales sp. CCMP2436]|nr:hypothetical protein T492DRAFT_899368 [Pavlovales sp. CCMP2436]